MDISTLAAARKYTDNSIAGTSGALAGKNCTVDSITDITGGHRVTFKWTSSSGSSQTDTMDVMDGSDGNDGVSPSVSVTDITGGHKVTITDSTGDHEFNVMDGATGATGAQGPAGPGVATGGTTGQILRKKSNTNYDTEWTTPDPSEIVFTGTMAQYEAVADTIPNGSAILITDSNPDLASLRNIAIQSIDIEYSRGTDTSYYIARIPKYAVNGMRITPKVRLTSADGALGNSIADYTSTLDYAKRKGSIFVVNASLFKINGNYAPHGRTIIDGVAVTDEDAGQTVSDVSAHEVYPLCIDASGNLSTPYDRDVPCATMIAGGVRQACTGWGTVVQNYEATDDTVFDEQKHVGDYIRQGIGQYQNGDYFVLTTDGLKTGIENEVGLTYEEVANICIAKGVKFFYSLDGGGSTETVIGDRQINLIYENTTGRVVPCVIEFFLEDA